MKYNPKRTVPNWAPGSWDYLETLLCDDDFCFEWGGGQSTKWLADRVGFVLTVENRLEWAARTLALTKDCKNCQLILASRLSRRYVDSVDLLPDANVYLIDGYQRINCLAKMMDLLRRGDIIVLDDALDYARWANFQPNFSSQAFRMPHPSAGKPIPSTDHGNSKLKVHAEFKETWIIKVP